MIFTQSANWSLAMAFVIGLATNFDLFAYGGPGGNYGTSCPGGQCRAPSFQQPLYANSAYPTSVPAFDPGRFSNAASLLRNGGGIRNGGEIVLFSPRGTLREAQYMLNGVPYVLKPGTVQRLKNDRVWKIEVNTGTGQVMRYTLAPGGYKFVPTGLGLSMGLFATQERPVLTSVAAATAPIPSELLATSIGTPATSAVPPVPMFDLMTTGQERTQLGPRAFAASAISMHSLETDVQLETHGQRPASPQPAASAVSPIYTYGRTEPRLDQMKLRRRFSEHLSPSISASQWINASHAISHEEFRDKVVLLDFWGSWCGPCVRNLPKVEALYEKYKDRGLIVLGVHSAQGAGSVAAFMANHGYSFPVAVDTGDTAERYGVEGWPTYFLVDKSGQQTWKFAQEPPTEQQIENLLK